MRARQRTLGEGRIWCGPPLRLQPAATVLDLPLRPSPRLRTGLWLLRLLILAYVVELLLERHGLAAVLVALLAVIGLWNGRTSGWRSLRLEVDGRLFLARDGGVEQVWLGSGSLRLGPHLLLVLRSGSGTHRLLFGPDNLGAGELATLKRRLPSGTAAATTALHSVAAPGSKSSAPL